MWAAAIPGGVRTLQSFSSLPSTHAPRLSASFASLAKKLVFLCPYLSPPQSAILPTPTTFFGVPSLTYDAPSPTRLPAASPTMTTTFLHDSTVPLWLALGLSSIIFLAASYCFISRTHAADNQHADHKESVSVSAELKTETPQHSQTYIFTLGLIVGLAIGLGIDSVPAPVILLTLAQTMINLAADAMVHYSGRLSLLWWKAMVLIARLPGHSRRTAWRIAHDIHQSQCYIVFKDITILRVSRTYDQLAQVCVSRLRSIASRFYSTDKYLRLAMNFISYIIGVYRCSPAVSSRAAVVLQLFHDFYNIVKNTWLVISRLPLDAKFRLPPSISWKWTGLVEQDQAQSVLDQSHREELTNTAAPTQTMNPTAEPSSPSYEDIVWKTVMDNSPVGTLYPTILNPRTPSGRRTRISYFLHADGRLHPLDPSGRISSTLPPVSASWL